MGKTETPKNEPNNEMVLAEIKKVICRLTDASQDEIEVTTKLTSDLRMTSPQVKSLAAPFSKIAQGYKVSASIGMDECLQLVTIQNCVDLIMGKIK